MPLTEGTKLGSYEILSLIGAERMGEVYKARDTKHGREVIIKVLPEAFSPDTVFPQTNQTENHSTLHPWARGR